MENEQINIFQVDSDIVKKTFHEEDNFLIEFDLEADNDFCAIYFASNHIYYPNDLATFSNNIVKQNRFEWVNQKMQNVHKHIFVRDIKKQWYLDGINGVLSSPNKMLEFFRIETKGYRLITIGSSAGGYAAVLFGQSLNADRIYSFNAQFELFSLLKSSNKIIDPLIFKYQNNKNLIPYYDLINFIQNPSNIYYFTSEYSKWDKDQIEHIKSIGIKTIFFKTNHHGIPFPKNLMPIVLNYSKNELNKLVGKRINPILFSIDKVGLLNTSVYLSRAIFNKIKKSIIDFRK